MPTINNQFLRVALALHAQLTSNCRNDRLIELPQCDWDRCTDLVRQIRRAQLRGWHLAANERLKDFRYSMLTLADELAALREQLPSSNAKHCTASAADIYQDILALSEHFEELDVDMRTNLLTVTTEPIVLEGVYLGEFEIALPLRVSREGPTYRVVAKDPHSAENRENVTHPHVMDNTLCEGEGRTAIRQALAQGRLLDFFTLVAGVLRNYNSESPFVELALWHGGTCSDCGVSVDDQCSYTCSKCDDMICSDCETTCCGCDDACCSNCTGLCPACENNFCRHCLKLCEGCQRRVCSGCLNDDERCATCHDEELCEDEPDTAAAAAEPALQPHCLGEAVVSA